MPEDEEKFQRLRSELLTQSDTHEWLEEEDVSELVRIACRKNIPTQVILACREACNSESAFVHHLSGLVGKRSRRILAIDDEQDFLDLLKTSLEHGGRFSVATETDPFHALEIVDEFRPDLCIVDMKMPEMDGNELIKRIRQRSLPDENTNHRPHRPVVRIPMLRLYQRITSFTYQNGRPPNFDPIDRRAPHHL
ncbi:MAG: response regulator [Verrucomicrobiales bacterium]